MVTDYIEQVKAKLIASKIIRSFSMVAEQILEDQGYFRARLWLVNGDFLEVAEYFKVIEGQVVTDRYRYQWMDSSQKVLRTRWDNVPHFPNLPGFPHHVHVKDQVQTSVVLSIIQVLDLVEDEFALE